MGVSELYQKIRSNFKFSTFVGALTSMDRFNDILSQVREGLKSDAEVFMQAYQTYSEYDNFVPISLNNEGEVFPIAFVREYQLPGKSKTIFVPGGSSKERLHYGELMKKLMKQTSLQNIPRNGYFIPGTTSERHVLNNGLMYLGTDPANGEMTWLEPYPLAPNKQGGLYIQHDGNVQIASNQEFQGIMEQESGIAIMPTSLYFENLPELGEMSDIELFQHASQIAMIHGYEDTYNNTIGFLTQDNQTGEMGYISVCISKELATEALGLDREMYTGCVPMFIYSALLYAQSKGRNIRMAALEENALATPIPYRGFSSDSIPGGCPVVFLYER